MNKITKAIIGIAAAVAALAASAPTASAAESPATVRVTNRGDMLVRLHADDVDVRINSNGVGNYAVWVTDSDGQLHVQDVFGVTRHARIEYQGHENVRIDFGKDTASSIPADLRISGDSSGNKSYFTGFDLTVGDDVLVRGDVEFALSEGKVADDFIVYPANGAVMVRINQVKVADRFYVRRSSTSSLGVQFAESEAGSFSVSGGPFNDSVTSFQSELGSAPRVLLEGGDDSIFVDGSTWTDVFFFRGAAGNDRMKLFGFVGTSVFDVAMQDGADVVSSNASSQHGGAGSVFDGGNGEDRFDDLAVPGFPDATITKFECLGCN